MLEPSLITADNVYAQVIRFFITLTLGILVTKIIFVPAIGKLASKTDNVQAQSSISNIGSLIGIFASFTIALQAANFGNLVTVIGTIAAAATVAIGFGMRDQIASLVAGVFIHTDNPFIKGDYLKVGDTEGVVKRIKMRATILNGPNQAKQIVPNNKLTTEVVKNYTRGKKTKVSIETKIPLEDLEQHSEILLEIADSKEKILSKPEPEITNQDVDDGKAVIELKYWVNNPERVKDSRSEIIEEYSKFYSDFVGDKKAEKSN